MNNGEIVFDDCRVPEDHLLARGDALGKAGVYFRPGKIIQAAKNLGIGIAAYQDTAVWVQQRVQGGRILIKHQAVALRIAAMATKLEAVSALLQRAARAVDENHPDAARLCDMVKVFTSQEILQVCRHAVELHGGYGALLEAGVEKYLREAVYLHMDATADVSNFKIAKTLFPRHCWDLRRPGVKARARAQVFEPSNNSAVRAACGCPHQPHPATTALVRAALNG